MYPAILSCRRPKLQLLRLSGACLPTPAAPVSCPKRIEPISTLGEQKANLNHM
jgi:hypothetical protein